MFRSPSPLYVVLTWHSVHQSIYDDDDEEKVVQSNVVTTSLLSLTSSTFNGCAGSQADMPTFENLVAWYDDTLKNGVSDRVCLVFVHHL
jgi:hypothetical protein